MKNIFEKTTLLITVAAVFFLFACGEKKEPVTASDVKEEIKEAVEATGIFTQQKKDEYFEQFESKINEWEQEITGLEAKLESKATELTQEGKAEWKERLETLRNKKEMTAQKLDELKTAASPAWEELKKGMDAALEDLNKAFEAAREEFK